MFVSIDPRCNQRFAEQALDDVEQVTQKLDQLTQASLRIKALTPEQRGQALSVLAQAIRSQKVGWAALITQEMGKLSIEAEDELERSAKWCEFLAERGPLWLAEETNQTGLISRQPHGVVLAITPWNFPLWQILRPLAAAWMAGNAIALKCAPNVAQISAALVTLCQQYLEPAAVHCLWVDEPTTEQLIAHASIKMVVCTGSEQTGRRVAQMAGANLKPMVLELGGNNPLLVLEDTDIAAAAHAAAESRCGNAGQACTAAKRMIVHSRHANDFTEALCTAMATRQPKVSLAPLARQDLLQYLHQQVIDSIKQGAHCLLGGEAYPGPGFYYPTTVLNEVEPGMRAFEEELFGPVAAISIARDDQHALELANSVRQGLCASIWSQNTAHAKRFASQLNVGLVAINHRPTSRFELPFAGMGAAGMGSTLGREGLLAFTRPAALLA